MSSSSQREHDRRDALGAEQQPRGPDQPQEDLIKRYRRDIAHALFFDLNLNDHHTQSFDDCTERWIRDIVLNHGNITTVFEERMYCLTLLHYRFVKDSMVPSKAHAYNSSYTGRVVVDVREMVLTRKQTPTPSDNTAFPFVDVDTLHRNITICELPIMLYSKCCHFSEGYDLNHQTEPEYAGGFIVKGKRRYIPLLKSLMNNYPFRFYNKHRKTFTVQVRSEHLDRKHRSTSTIELILDEDKAKRSSIFYNVVVNVPFLPPTVPVTILVLAMGWTLAEFQGAVQHALGHLWDEALFDNYFLMLRHDHHGCETTEDALHYIGNLYGKVKNTSSAMHMIHSEVFPHMNGDDNPRSKGFYLAYIYGILVLFRERRLPETDRDSRIYTRLIDSGTSLAVLFRLQFLNFVQQGLKILRRVLNREDKQVDVRKIYNHVRLSQKLISAIATGMWSNKRKGVSHPMVTTNEQAIISQLRRISSSYLNNDGKHLGPRMVHNSSFGYECAAETPEGYPKQPILLRGVCVCALLLLLVVVACGCCCSGGWLLFLCYTSVFFGGRYVCVLYTAHQQKTKQPACFFFATSFVCRCVLFVCTCCCFCLFAGRHAVSCTRWRVLPGSRASPRLLR